MKKKTILYTLLILSLLGLIASIYLVHLHYKQFDSFCDFNARFSCTSINQSAYANIFGVPVSILGVLGYTFFLLVPLLSLFNVSFSGIYQRLTILRVWKFYFLVSFIALLFSFYLTYLELHTIKVICPLCVFSQIIIITIVFFSYVLMNKIKKVS